MAGSESESVFLQCYDEIRFQVALTFLSDPVSVEGGWLSAEKIRLVLEVVVF